MVVSELKFESEPIVDENGEAVVVSESSKACPSLVTPELKVLSFRNIIAFNAGENIDYCLQDETGHPLYDENGGTLME